MNIIKNEIFVLENKMKALSKASSIFHRGLQPKKCDNFQEWIFETEKVLKEIGFERLMRYFEFLETGKIIIK